jgi:hypothetical protein
VPAERCRVGVMLNGLQQYYQRDREEKRNGKWASIPYFIDDIKQAAVMSEAVATTFVKNLQTLGVKNPLWIEDCKDGRRIEVASEAPQSGEDNRTAMIASLDDINEYVVYPIARPEGRKYFLKINVPGLPNPYIAYGDDPLATLSKAADMDYLRFAQKYERPQQAAPAVQNTSGWRNRIGAIR